MIKRIERYYDENFSSILRELLSILFILLKSNDLSISDKIKLLPIDKNYDDIRYKALVHINSRSIPRPRADPVTTAARKNQKKNTVVKIAYEPDFVEKAVICPSVKEIGIIYQINESFERAYQHNVFECVNKLVKIEPEKETFLNEFYSQYANFREQFVSDLCADLNLNKFSYDVGPPNQTI